MPKIKHGHICFFDDLDDESIAVAGGKGANLGRLYRAGFNVPPGFVVTSSAYRVHVPTFDTSGLDVHNVAELESAAEAARRKVSQVTMPQELIDDIMVAYRKLGQPRVAVRSSATAEDLPTASFAGQQDSFLHVQGEQALIEAIHACWVSLWTTRAVQYRARMGFDSRSLAMAVIVQAMAPHEVSGVVFTINPISGKPSEILINAVPGTGDKLVGGETTPDQWIARRPDGAVLHFTSARKGSPGNRFMQRVSPTGCLTTPQVRQLAQLSLDVESLFDDMPQDIEWSFGEGRFFVLQSRPVTT